MILLEKYVKFLVKNNITERQFLILLFIYYKRQDLIGLYKQQFTNNKNIITAKNGAYAIFDYVSGGGKKWRGIEADVILLDEVRDIDVGSINPSFNKTPSITTPFPINGYILFIKMSSGITYGGLKFAIS